MTLITAPPRVHFADAILEEALYGEVERAGVRRPLVVRPASLRGTDLDERLIAGIPPGVDPWPWFHGPGERGGAPVGPRPGAPRARVSGGPLRRTARRPDPQGIDAVIAFGSARSLALGRDWRKRLSEASARRIPLVAILGLDGLPEPDADRRDTWRLVPPDVLICDPTLIRDATPEGRLRAALASLVRCVEAYLAPSYNPVADGMALDGLHRCLAAIPGIGAGCDGAVSREMMAASLGAGLSQDKGTGPARRIAHALGEVCRGADEASAAFLLLPGTLEAWPAAQARIEALRRIFGCGDRGLAARLRALVAGLPVARRLGDIGLSRDDVEAAARVAERRFGLDPRAVTALCEQVL